MEDAKLSMYQNVLVRAVNHRTGDIVESYCSNRVTKNALLGIARFIYGDFSSNNVEQASRYTPKFLALGGYPSSATPLVPENVGSVNAIRLTNEITNTAVSGSITPRIEIASRTITNEIANDYVKLSMKIFVPSSSLANTVINEAGLFITGTGDSCWARVGINPAITKDSSTTIDIVWDITIRSIANS